MEAMMHLELTFCGFEGTRRMRQAMQSAKLPEPQFRQIEAHAHQVHVTLRNDISTRKALSSGRAAALLSAEQMDSLSSDERTIVRFLVQAGETNITNAALVVRKSWPTTSKLIASLVERGILEAITKRGRSRDSSKTYRLAGTS
jgi:predicted HTH transcriptional regulator